MLRSNMPVSVTWPVYYNVVKITKDSLDIDVKSSIISAPDTNLTLIPVPE